MIGTAAGGAAYTAPSWLPAAIAGGSALTSMIGGAAQSMFGGSSKTRYKANKFGGDAYRQRIGAYWNETMRQARRHKVHPLFALGGHAPAASPPVPVGGSSQNDIQGMVEQQNRYGQEIARSLTGPVQTVYARKMAEINLAQADETLTYLKNRNRLTELQINRMQSPGISASNQYGIPGQSSIVESDLGPDDLVEWQRSQLPYSQQLGSQAGTAPMTQPGIDSKGFRYTPLSSPMQFRMMNDPVARWKYGFRRIAQHLKDWSKTQGQLMGIYDFASELRERRSKLEPPPRGRHWEYDAGYNQWQAVPNSHGYKLFNHRNRFMKNFKY